MSTDTIAIVVAILSLVLAALSLGWQAATFFLEGGRVKATFNGGFVGSGMVVTVAPDKFADPDTIEFMRSQGYANPVASVQVRNVGRMPVTITSWSVVAYPGKTALQPVGQSIGPSLPHRLDAGESAIWAVDFRAVYAMLKTTATVLKLPEGGMRAKATVSLGDGRTVNAKGQL